MDSSEVTPIGHLLEFSVVVADDPEANETGIATSGELAKRFPDVAAVITHPDFYYMHYMVDVQSVSFSFHKEGIIEVAEPEWPAAPCPRCGQSFEPCEAAVLANTEAVGCPFCQARIVYQYSEHFKRHIWFYATYYKVP